jgi:hypothetical protein
MGNQPQQIDVNRNSQKKNGNENVGGNPKIDVVQVKVTTEIDQHNRKQHNADQPEENMLEKVVPFFSFFYETDIHC